MARKNDQDQTVNVATGDPVNDQADVQSQADAAKSEIEATRRKKTGRPSNDESKYMKAKRAEVDAAAQAEKDAQLRRFAKKLTDIELNACAGGLAIATNRGEFYALKNEETSKGLEDGWFDMLKAFGIETTVKALAVVSMIGGHITLATQIKKIWDEIQVKTLMEQNNDNRVTTQ